MIPRNKEEIREVIENLKPEDCVYLISLRGETYLACRFHFIHGRDTMFIISRPLPDNTEQTLYKVLGFATGLPDENKCRHVIEQILNSVN